MCDGPHAESLRYRSPAALRAKNDTGPAMSTSICLAAYALRFPRGGAYAWVFLNWALGLRELGYRVIWLDSVTQDVPLKQVVADASELHGRLQRFGISELAVIRNTDGSAVAESAGFPGLELAESADLLLNLGYDLADDVVARFRRSAFIDIDPGLTQVWIAAGQLRIPRHDLYFTYGEFAHTGTNRSIPCGDVRWRYVRPPVALHAWPLVEASPSAPYTTVSNWWDEQAWIRVGGHWIDNSKRTSFLEYLAVPEKAHVSMELALPFAAEQDSTGDVRMLLDSGWRLRDSRAVSCSPEAHRRYVQLSRGEFSCMKHGYRHLQTAWIGERSLNYLASGKPALVQWTGVSCFLPDRLGLWRFRSSEEAVEGLRTIEENYDLHSKAARQVVQEHFDARRVIPGFLEHALN